MTPPLILTFRLVSGLTKSTLRAIGFLEGHPELDAGTTFDDFVETEARQFRARMDRWLSGLNGPPSHFHGFTSDEKYKECFTFKYKEHRLYGFFCHPMPRDRRFQLCVLNIYAVKHERETHYAELDRVNQWRNNPAAVEAISNVYPEFGGAKSKWKQ